MRDRGMKSVGKTEIVRGGGGCRESEDDSLCYFESGVIKLDVERNRMRRRCYETANLLEALVM